MPSGTITSTVNTFGTVNGAISGTVAGTLTGSVGVPGPQGPAGAAGPQGPQGDPGAPGQGVAAGGSTGQVLQKLSATSYDTGWLTLPADYITSVTSPLAVTSGVLSVDLSAYLTSATAASTYQTLAGMSSYLTTATAASTYYLQTNPSGFQTAGDVTTALSPYLTSATAASTYAVIAAGQPVAGSSGQVLTKQSGTNWDSIWATPVVGDRYLTTSTTSNTLSNTNKTFTIGTGLSYTPTQNITISYDASNHMHGEVLTYNSGTGVLTVDINHHTGSGTYAAWVVNVGGVTPDTSVAWGAITGTLSTQTDLQNALNLKLDVTTAATTYYPLVGNPSGFLTSAPVTSVAGKVGVVTLDNTDISGLGTMSTATAADYSTTTVANGLYYPLAGNPSSFLVAADITGKANLASPSFTGNVSISSSTGAALFIEQTGTGNILTLHDQASDTTFVTIDANGKVSTIASEATNGAGFNIAHGVAPTSPVNGDVWTTTSGLFMRQSGTTRQYVDFDSTQTINGSKAFTNASQTLGNSTATGTINVASGATISASTKTVNVATGGVVGSTTLTTIGPVLGASTTSIGNTTAASTLNLATGATLTATTKAVNIGTAGVAGSTTNITIGSTTGTSTTTLQGTTNGITAAADTNSTALATTAYVVGQASSTTPLADGTAAVGTSLRYARADHVHPSSGGGGGADIQTFTTAGTATWTKPAGKTMAWIRMWSGGGGGGGGCSAVTTSARFGGGGGAGGGFCEAYVPISLLGATETVTVGAGGNGGASATTANGGNGSNGGNSVFNNFRAFAGSTEFGTGGTTTAGTGGAYTQSVVQSYNGFNPSIGSYSPGNGGTGTSNSPGGSPVQGNPVLHLFTNGGGGGGGAAASSTLTASGGAGGSKTANASSSGLVPTIAGGAGGNPATPSNPIVGTSAVSYYIGATGGGGGGYKLATAGQTGAVGGQPGGGGGGGGAADAGFASGAGGAGGAGMVIVVCY